VQELFAEVRILLQLVLSELKTIRELQERTLKQAQARPEPVAPAIPRQPSPPMPDFSPMPEPAPVPEPEPELRPEPGPDIEVFEEPPPAPARRPAPSPKPRRRILLIDDDVETRAAAERTLADAGFVVDTAGEGNEGLGRIGAAKPDLVVLELDIRGEMGGEDVITLIKATMDWVDIPIVLHTRVAADVAEEARATHGADDVVVKQPASPGKLLQSIREVFEKM
jgi:CheY-like chemotaxis protein